MARRALMLREGKAPVWDRLLTMLFLAGLLHGLIILGLTFNAAAGDKDSCPGSGGAAGVGRGPGSGPEPDRHLSRAAYAAWARATREKPVKPRTTGLGAAARSTTRAAPRATRWPTSGDQAGSAEERVLTTIGWSTHVHYLADARHRRRAPATSRCCSISRRSAQPGPEDEQGPAQLRGPKRDELWITPDTRAATLAPYLDAWRRKVERIGTLNYPTAARTTAASSSPVVEVAIGANGTLDKAVIRRSSGDPELDQAALAILKLASPFDPFPPELAAQYRVLHFAYEWQFSRRPDVGSGILSTVP